MPDNHDKLIDPPNQLYQHAQTVSRNLTMLKLSADSAILEINSLLGDTHPPVSHGAILPVFFGFVIGFILSSALLMKVAASLLGADKKVITD